MNGETPTHATLRQDLKDVNERLQLIHDNIVTMKLELHSAVQVHATKIAQHEKEIVHAFEDIHKLEDRSWRAGGAVMMATLSLLATVAVTILAVVL